MNTLKKDIGTSEYAPFYANYMALAPDLPLNESLIRAHVYFEKIIKQLSTSKLSFTYAEGKWTIAEVMVHILDAELVFLSRALHIARQPSIELPGYDQDEFVATSQSENLSLEELLNLWNAQQKTTSAWFNSFSETALTNVGIANEHPISVRALGFIIAGHKMHHANILLDRYLSI
jgi:hypothetical protein